MGLPIYFAGIVTLVGRNALQLATGTRLDSIDYGNLSLALMVSGVLSLVPSAISKAKFKGFAISTRISTQIWIGSVIVMLIGSGILLAMAYVYVLFVLGTEYKVMLPFVPLLLLAAFFRGLGDIINRFFFAKGRAKILSGISLKIGGVNLVSGVPLVYVFGIWGAVIARLLESMVFLILNGIEYIHSIDAQKGRRDTCVHDVDDSFEQISADIRA